jgi:hypothetical protein
MTLFTELLAELIGCIASIATVGTVAAMDATCRAWFFAIRSLDEAVWKQRALERFPRLEAILLLAPPLAPFKFRDIFHNQQHAEKCLQFAPTVDQHREHASRTNQLERYIFTVELLCENELKAHWTGPLMAYEPYGCAAIDIDRFPLTGGHIWTSPPRWLTDWIATSEQLSAASDDSSDGDPHGHWEERRHWDTLRCHVFVSKDGHTLPLQAGVVADEDPFEQGLAFAAFPHQGFRDHALDLALTFMDSRLEVIWNSV